MTDDPLDERTYHRVRRATRTYREDLVIRLAGEVGLRPAEMTRVTLADVSESAVEGRMHYLLSVEGSSGERRAYLPRDVYDDLAKYARERAVGPADPILDVSPRRIQMLVAEVGDRLEDASVSSRSLRRLFARRLLEERSVNPRVVQAVGGWASLDPLADLFAWPDDDAIVRAVADDGQRDPATNGERTLDSRFVAAVEAVQAIGRTVDDTATRSDVEEMACGALVERGHYGAAWITGAVDGEHDPTARAWAGLDRDSLDAVVDGLEREGETPRQRTAVETGTVQVGRIRSWPGADRQRSSVAVVPVTHGETTFGTMTVATSADRAFADRERAVLADLGRRLGQAIAAVSNRRLLLADAVVELDFHSGDEGSFFVETARQCGCTFDLDGLVPVSEHSLVLYLRVSGTAPEAVVDRAADADGVTRARLIRSGSGDAVVEVVVASESLAVTLTEYGGNVTTLSVDERGASVTAEFPRDVDVRSVVRGLTAAFPDSEFVAKREASHPVSSPVDLRETYAADLTDKQRSVLRAAYLAGYFDWPRGTTAEELADSLGISSPTLHNHLRKAQRSILSELFEDGGTAR